MAALKNLSTLMILSVVAAMLLPRATFAVDGNPSCGKGMSYNCGSGFFQIIVLADTFDPSPECCGELVKAGKNCHSQFVDAIIASHKHIRGTVADVYRRSNETWNNCAAATKPAY